MVTRRDFVRYTAATSAWLLALEGTDAALAQGSRVG